jgi:arylsulfatase A-like enzyme
MRPRALLGALAAGLGCGAPAGDADPGAAGAAPAAPRPHVVVYLVDTLRRDHLGAYGYPRPTSPHLDAFAAESALFTAASAQSSWTRPAVASLLTGQNPQTHGVTGKLAALGPEPALLPELLARAGWATWAVVANGNVSPAFGFERGFERHRQLPEAFTPEVHQRSERVNEVALAWLDEREDERPFLLYLHTADPHGPYTPPEPQRARLAPGVSDPAIGSMAQLRALAQGAPLERGSAADLAALYDGEIAHNDASFGALLAGLRQRGLYQRSLVVFLSDHGEAFREHGAWQHGTTLFEEELAIPLVIRLPDGRGRGARVAAPARQIDVLPTLLDALGLEIPAQVEGTSLLPLLEGARPAPREAPVVAHLLRDALEVESAAWGGRKLVRWLGPQGAAPRRALFDLRRDPGERHDLAREEPAWVERLEAELRGLRARAPARERAREAPLGAGERERLEALGYL